MSVQRRALPSPNLIALILAITALPLGTLLWLGWRLLQQDRILENQQAHQRIESAADLVVAAFQRSLSASAQRLAAGNEQWPEGAVSVTFREDTIDVFPKRRVAYQPVIPTLPEAPADSFASGEAQEFRNHDYPAAIGAFRELARSPDLSIRAGALLRLGRNLANAGKTVEALGAYAELSTMDAVAAGGVPAGLLGQYLRCELLDRNHRASELREQAQRFSTDLISGRWNLTAPVYWLYAADATRWTGRTVTQPLQSETFAEAIGALWERRRSMPASGQDSLLANGQNLAVIWQTSGDSLRALIANTAFVNSQWLTPAVAVADEYGVSIYIGDANAPDGSRVKRSTRETGLPWDVVVASRDSAALDATFAVRRRLLIAGFVLLVGMAFAASYLIVRAVNRELAVARLQSDFVAAVSHEFRTPLTALRQFTDMLREHPGLGEDRRQICYESQARATDRLTRLVESLLDFGRMEAGARRYQFEPRDCTELIRGVVEDFRADPQAAGFEIEFHGNGSSQIQTDSEALTRAVWNLLDNAVKYSPDQKKIEVFLKRQDSDVRIAVRDHGIGIPAQERAAIFVKFHRGEQARIRGIKGTGIGLAMVDEIVRAHHGRVEVLSEPGKGSTFSLILPATE